MVAGWPSLHLLTWVLLLERVFAFLVLDAYFPRPLVPSLSRWNTLPLVSDWKKNVVSGNRVRCNHACEKVGFSRLFSVSLAGCISAVCGPMLHPGVACRETYRGMKTQVEEIHDEEEGGEGPGGGAVGEYSCPLLGGYIV